MNHKRYFGIECQHYEFSVQFVFDEPEAAKYVWKMCVLQVRTNFVQLILLPVMQHTFYKMHQSATESTELNITLSPPGLGEPPLGPASIRHADIASFQQRSQVQIACLLSASQS